MQTEFAILEVSKILDLRRNKMLTVNPEYQRGNVWSAAQKKRLIDSLLRGYRIPLIYLHHIKTSVAGMQREDLEVVDSQQRINAMYEFKEGALRLFDPEKDKKEARFPEFISKEPCEWAGCTFDKLSSELKTKFLSTPLYVVKITTPNFDEARDLFIRLQSGLPLNAQEKRDALPGCFNEFILKVAGKPEITRYPGQEFFRELVGGNSQTGRGRKRQLCAQMAMLYIERRESGVWVDINRTSVDDYYYQKLDFDPSCPSAESFTVSLGMLWVLLGDGRRKPLKGHEAIHLVLLADSLNKDYVASCWKHLAPAFDRFREAVAKDKLTRDTDQPGEFWTNYDARTRVAADMAETLRFRHQFFLKKMLDFMGPLQLKDPKRLYGEVEREFIYYRDQRKCAVCGGDIAWKDLEIHHVQEHKEGGPTSLDNGRAVHKQCHP